jgi:hypothetical protein
MAATFSLDHAYPVSAPDLLATLSDTDYVEQKMVAIGFDEVSATHDGGKLEIHRTTEPPLPGFAAKVLGGRQRIVEIQEWTPGEVPTGTFHAKAAGTPVTITGTFVIEPDGDGSVLQIRGTVEAKVPLVGGKVAGLVADQTAKTLDQEYAFTKAWIAEH